MNERTDPTSHDCDPERFSEIVDRPESYTLDVHASEQRHIEGTDAFVPYDAMSREVTEVLSELGYEEIYHLRGGIQE